MEGAGKASMAESATHTQIEILYKSYGAMVHRRCLRILGNEQDAMDATQEVFARVTRHYGSFRAEAAPSTWLMRISTNHCLNVIRDSASRRGKLSAQRHELQPADSGTRAFDGIERAELIRALLIRFDPEIQRLVIHHYLDGMTKIEVADLCGLSVPTVRKRLNLFVRRSRRYLQRELLASLPRSGKEVRP
jgi:RNA polymerase sigma-70 factor (ECF subfamily)